MGWGQYRGRIPDVDPDNPIAWGRDDIRGLPVMHDDLVPVMQYAGSQIVWTGFMTHKDYVDIPQPQLAPARLRADPVPVENPRIFYMPKQPPIPTGLTLVSFTANTITIQWDSVLVATSYVVNWTNSVVSNPIKDIPITTDATITYTITGLSPNTYYLVQVATTYPEATSAYSSPVTVTTSS
jgi:fibronectin type III domain protein